MKIALFGGTFDPIHQGHIKIAELAKEHLQLDKVIFLPCKQSPHKLDRKTANELHRLEMCQHAIKHIDWAEVHDCDLTSPPPSYSWKTAEYFNHKIYPDAELYWLMGTDQWNSLHKWSRFEHLATLVKFIVCTRGSAKLNKLDFSPDVIKSSHPASSTKIREDLKADREPLWLNNNVREYIYSNNIYSHSTASQ